jgi:ATP-dependent Clp protease ATP-binding subunit ClpB
VVLFDEIEKAHPDVFNILLQVLDDGRLTDNKGRTVNFKNTIIIMTSNLGSQLIRERVEQAGGMLSNNELDSLNKQLLAMLKQTIRPEFLNRIDETIMFLPLTQKEISQVVELQLNNLKHMLADQDVELQFTPQAVSYLAEVGYDPEFGARPVKRAIQRYVLNELSKKLLGGTIDRSRPIVIDEFGDGLVFHN